MTDLYYTALALLKPSHDDDYSRVEWFDGFDIEFNRSALKVDKELLDKLADCLVRDETATQLPGSYVFKKFLYAVAGRRPEEVLECLNQVADKIDGSNLFQVHFIQNTVELCNVNGRFGPLSSGVNDMLDKLAGKRNTFEGAASTPSSFHQQVKNGR